jgi:hypothetical protein
MSRNEYKRNLILKDVCLSADSYKKVIIFLVIEKEYVDHYSEPIKKEFELVKEKFNLKGDIKNPIIKVILSDFNLGIGRKRKIMMLLAEHFDFKKFYFIDDDIDSFYQYDDYERDHAQYPNQALNALRYMSTVLDSSVNKLDEIVQIENDICIEWGDNLAPFKKAFSKTEHENQSYKKLRELIQGKIFNDRDMIMSLLSVLIKSENINESERNDIKEIENEIKDKLYNKKLKVIGQIGLWNRNSHLQTRTLEDRLRSLSKSTHFVSSVRYQVVIFNLEAIRGIHPVSDDVLFEKPLSVEEKVNLILKAKNQELNNENACRAAKLGYKYSDKAHVFYQIVNGVTGFEIFNFSFKDKVGCPSKVNSDTTLEDLAL